MASVSIREGSEVTSYRSEIGSEQGSRGTVIRRRSGIEVAGPRSSVYRVMGEGHLSITNGGEYGGCHKRECAQGMDSSVWGKGLGARPD